MTISIYPWQVTQWQHLLKRKHKQQLSHALLLAGPQGVGKLDFALNFAKLLLCETDSDTDTTCNSCMACKLLQANAHPDLLLIVNAKETKKTIKIEEIRAITHKLSQKSHRNGYKIVIIENAEIMTLAASNALLKTLEEPPGQSILILTTKQPTLLPITIRSRCQLLTFYTIAQETAKQWLAQYTNINAIPIDNLLNITNNAPLLTLELINDGTWHNFSAILSAFTKLASKQISALQFAQLCIELELEYILLHLQRIVLDILRIKLTSKQQFITNTNDLTTITKLAHNMNVLELTKLADLITTKLRQLSHNLNKQLLLEELGFSIKRISRAS